MRKRSAHMGFTIAELVVVMVIISVLSIMLAAFVITWVQSASLAQVRTNLLLDAENALDTVGTDIQLSGSADDVNRWADPYSPSGSYGWASNSQTLVLAKIATDKSNNVIFSDPVKYVTQKDNQIYYLSGTTLYRRTLASDSAGDSAITTCPPANATASCPADTTIATGVSSWSLTYYDANDTVVAPSSARSVQIAITLSKKLDSQTITASYTARMVFRNG